MTQPPDAAFPQPTAAEAAVGALVENKNRLGLTWDLRPATVLGTNATGKINLAVDGDTGPVSADSMIGPVDPQSRVYVITLPTGGIFIAGTIGTPSLALAGKAIGSAYWTGGTQAGSTGTEVTAVWTGASEFVLQPNRVAMLTLMGNILTNAGTVTGQVVRVRNVIGTTAATQIMYYQFTIAPGIAGGVTAITGISYIKSSTAPSIFNPGVTNIRTIGVGTSSLYGDGNVPLTLMGIDIGATDDPVLAAIVALAPVA